MRRKDREITDPLKIRKIIEKCDCCRLGFSDGNRVYIVPLNFGYIESEGKRTFFFHGAEEGRKIDLIIRNGYAGFELDTNHGLNEKEAACEFSFRFQSVIGEGKVVIVKGTEEKRAGLQTIMNHYSDRQNWEFSDKMLAGVTVFKLEVEGMTCKEHA